MFNLATYVWVERDSHTPGHVTVQLCFWEGQVPFLQHIHVPESNSIKATCVPHLCKASSPRHPPKHIRTPTRNTSQRISLAHARKPVHQIKPTIPIEPILALSTNHRRTHSFFPSLRQTPLHQYLAHPVPLELRIHRQKLQIPRLGAVTGPGALEERRAALDEVLLGWVAGAVRVDEGVGPHRDAGERSQEISLCGSGQLTTVFLSGPAL